MKILTKNLIDGPLDWAVKKALGDIGIVVMREGKWLAREEGKHHYSTDWSQGGPILDREGIATRRHSNGTWYAMLSSDLGDGERAQWCQYTFKNAPIASGTSRQVRFEGPTPLIAAMRCHIASKLGYEVDVPEELL